MAKKRDPKEVLGLITALAYAAVMGGKVAVWGLEDKSHLPLILAPLLFIVAGLIGYRWWKKTRHEEWISSGGRRDRSVQGGRRCRKCGASLEGVAPKSVSIGGLNVSRVVCPECGRVEA